MIPFLADLDSHWRAQGIACAEPASDAAIKAFEQEFAVRLPEDFASYLRTLNGMDLGHDGAMDGEMISFWRLDDIRKDRIEHPSVRSELFGFADWSIDACIYEIQLSADPAAPAPVFIRCDEPVQVAASFAEFVAAYVRNDERALYAKGL